MFSGGKVVEGRAKKVKENNRYKFSVIKSVSHGDVIHGIGSIVSIVRNFVWCQVVTGLLLVITLLGI